MFSSPSSRHGGAADAGGGDVERQYAGEYEERVNPFREFIAGERSLRRRQLSAPDRIMYELGQVVSSSRCARGALASDTAGFHDTLCPGSLQMELPAF